MRISDLFESPISNVSHIGDWDKSSSFRHIQDRKLLTNPKAVNKIKSMWKYPEENMFNIILVNHPDGSRHTEVGIIDTVWLKTNMPRTVEEIIPLLDDTAINIIYTNNSGVERVPATGWTLAHRFGHALQASNRGGKRNNTSYYFKEATDEFISMTRHILDLYGIHSHSPRRELDFNGPTLGFLRQVCTFKSARDHAIRNPYEVPYEMLAQYMITGKITMNDLPKSFRYGNGYYSFDNREADYDYWNRGYKEDMPDTMQQYFEACIGYSEGSIFLM